MAKAKREIQKQEIPPVPDTPIAEPVIDTPEEVKEGVIEEEVTPEPEIEPVKEEPKAEPIKPVEPIIPAAPVYRKEADMKAPFEERILAYMESRKMGEVRLNDFLKSLWPTGKFNEPPQWTNQGQNKYLRAVLDKMVQEGKIKIANDMHKRLGHFYYDGDNPETKYHNLSTIPISASM